MHFVERAIAHLTVMRKRSVASMPIYRISTVHSMYAAVSMAFVGLLAIFVVPDAKLDVLKLTNLHVKALRATNASLGIMRVGHTNDLATRGNRRQSILTSGLILTTPSHLLTLATKFLR